MSRGLVLLAIVTTFVPNVIVAFYVRCFVE